MTSHAAILAAVCGSACLGPLAAAQPGTRNAIVYGARAPGETNWHFGEFSLQSSDTSPLTFEVGVFFFRAQGYAFSTAIYKTYIDGVVNLTDTCAIIDDPSNGFSPDDGREAQFDSGAQTQKVLTNRHAGIPGLGFRISSTADAADASAAGGIAVKQPNAQPPGATDTSDGVLGYRFNLTLGFNGGPERTVLVHTPLSRINSYTTYNAADSNTTSEFKSSVVVDALTLHASWVPAPPGLVVLVCGATHVAGRRRRR